MYRLTRIWQPAMYQGKSKTKGFFEGWYYKLADKGEQHIAAIIPGVSYDKSGQHAHCFIQFLDDSGLVSHYYRQRIDDFAFSKHRPEIHIGNSCFTPSRMVVDVRDGNHSIKGALDFRGITPWPVTALSPGAMGWYAFVPGMECYHGVVSFGHSIEGKLELDGETVDYTGGKGYTEKDWGRSFPKYHIWIQTNHFDEAGTSLMASIANIPWLGRSFDGFLIGLWHNGRLHRFTTYTGARIAGLRYAQGKLNIDVRSRRSRIEIEVSNRRGAELRTPVLGEMLGRLSESLTAETRVRFYRQAQSGEELVFEGLGRHTGLEVEGELPATLRQ